MTRQQAIKFLDNACRAYKGTREDHVALQNAINLIQAELAQKDALQAELDALKVVPMPEPEAEGNDAAAAGDAE